jgi:hypothetical protein
MFLELRVALSLPETCFPYQTDMRKHSIKRIHNRELRLCSGVYKRRKGMERNTMERDGR